MGFDSEGKFTGLPREWHALLQSSAITALDMEHDPQSVLDVLEFYQENFMSPKTAPDRHKDLPSPKSLTRAMQLTTVSENNTPSDTSNAQHPRNNLVARKPLKVQTQLQNNADIRETNEKLKIKYPAPQPQPSRSPKKPHLELSKLSEAQLLQTLRELVTAGDPSLVYKKVKKIGQGASGSVYLAKSKASSSAASYTGYVAIKVMDLSAQPRKELIINEILVMRDSTHANIVNYLDSYMSGMELWVIMEYMEGGPLTDVCDAVKGRGLTEVQIATVCREVRFIGIFITPSEKLI